MVAEEQAWFCALGGGKRIGPINERELIELAKHGRLQGKDLVWKKGWHDWSTADSVPLLATVLSSFPPIQDAPLSSRAYTPAYAPTPMKFKQVLRAVGLLLVLLFIVSAIKFCVSYLARQPRVTDAESSSTSAAKITLADLNKIAVHENQKLPREIDSITSLERVEAGPGITLTRIFRVTLPGLNPATFSPEMAESIRGDLKHTICTTHQAGLQSGVKYGFKYIDLQDNVLDVFFIDRELCENEPKPERVSEQRPPEEDVTELELPPAPTPSERKLAWLNSEIERQRTRSEELWSYARRFDDYNHIGTLYNELNIPEHNCYLLGHLLRRGELVTHLEVQYDTDMSDTTTSGTHAIRVDAHSMDNFVNVADVLLKKAPEERVMEWNLDCVGQHGIEKDASIVSRGARSFYAIRNEGKVLQILGDIEPGFADKVASALDSNPDVTVVALGSGGGLVSEAIKAGMIIRERKLTTSLWNNCYSACPLVFLGGINRDVWSPYPKLGFHQLYTMEEGATSPDAPIYHVVRTYVQAMGAEPNYVLLNMWMAGPDEMNFLDPGSVDLCEKGITTWVQRRCNITDHR